MEGLPQSEHGGCEHVHHFTKGAPCRQPHSLSLTSIDQSDSVTQNFGNSAITPGYTDYQSYKPWLRDEFSFRCVYCLWRERWEADGHHDFGVEHVVPQVTSPEQRNVYDNLVYARNTCNSTRRNVSLPIHPSHDALGLHIRVLADGTVQSQSGTGQDLIDLCRLNRPLLVEARRRILNLLTILLVSGDPEAVDALRDLLAYPTDLPDLSTLRPPEGNTRPEGIVSYFFEIRQRGELPKVY